MTFIEREVDIDINLLNDISEDLRSNDDRSFARTFLLHSRHQLEPSLLNCCFLLLTESSMSWSCLPLFELIYCSCVKRRGSRIVYEIWW